MSFETETGWLADFIFRDGRFETGLAMFADNTGRITRFSTDEWDLVKANRFRNCAILPGLVNAHSHAFQRAIRGRTERPTSAHQDSFWTWREAMYQAANRLTPDDIYHVSRMAFMEMMLSGITTVGEFHYLHNAPDGSRYDDPNLLALEVIRAATETGLRIVLLRTAYNRAGYKKPANPLQARFITPSPDIFLADTEALRSCAWVGIAPHSVRAMPISYVVEIARYAQKNGLPVHMHASEQPRELEECLAEYGRRPIELLAQNGVLDASFTAIHAIHITDEEIRALGAAHSTVCACPTTERNLGDGAVPADRLGDARVDVCFGSDSNVQINLLEDARELEYHLRMKNLARGVVAPERLFAGATEMGAEALGTQAGKLEVGQPADFFTIDLDDPSLADANVDELLAQIVFCAERTVIRDVFVSGERVIDDGRHPLQEEIVSAFREVQRRVWEEEG